jgi:hypothetical protein
LLAINVSVIGSSQAQAAACSASDKKLFTSFEDRFSSANLLSGQEDLFNDYENYISGVFALVGIWKKASKSKKLKAALTKFETQFEIHGNSGRQYKYIPELTNAYNAVGTIIKFKRC